VSADLVAEMLFELDSTVSYSVPRCLYTTRVVLHSVERPDRAHMTQFNIANLVVLFSSSEAR
jgi:hypothetical protein